MIPITVAITIAMGASTLLINIVDIDVWWIRWTLMTCYCKVKPEKNIVCVFKTGAGVLDEWRTWVAFWTSSPVDSNGFLMGCQSFYVPTTCSKTDPNNIFHHCCCRYSFGSVFSTICFSWNCFYTVVNSMFKVLGVDGPLRLFVEFMEGQEGLRAELHK